MSDLALLIHHDDVEPPKPDPETEQEDLNDGDYHDDSPIAPASPDAATSGTDTGADDRDDDGDDDGDDHGDDHGADNGDATTNDDGDVDVDGSDDNNSDSGAVATKVTQDTILSLFEKIKTHFPAARIKKIMQLDDDIGKVAQATPIIVGRALEIFMANLVECAIIELRKQGVKRILALHIRAAVENLEQFDFLVDLVAKYPPMKH